MKPVFLIVKEFYYEKKDPFGNNTKSTEFEDRIPEDAGKLPGPVQKVTCGL